MRDSDLQNMVREQLGSDLDRVPESHRSMLLGRIERLLVGATTQERQRCVAACRARAALWRTTLAAKSKIATAQDEARARANEAEYLADLLENADDEGPGGLRAGSAREPV